MKQINHFWGGGSPTLMTPIDFTNDQNSKCRVI